MAATGEGWSEETERADRGDAGVEALILSLGGTPQPLAHSIRSLRPARVVFFVSSQSRQEIQTVRELAPECPEPRVIETPDAQRFAECFDALFDELPAILREWQVTQGGLAVDLTGGTKVMSAALALATIECAGRFVYVGGAERQMTPAGRELGTVKSGSEYTITEANPWMKRAIQDLRQVALLAGQCQFEAALGIVRERKPLLDRDSEEKRAFIFLEKLLDGYAHWDRFSHSDARSKLGRASSDVARLDADRWPGRAVAQLTPHIQRHCRFLEELLEGLDRRSGALRAGRAVVLDLLGNAVRRGRKESKWDDAVARIYRAAEAVAQWKLAEKGIADTGCVPWSELPEDMRLARRPGRDGSVKLGLRDAFELLRHRGVREGIVFMDQAAALEERLVADRDGRREAGSLGPTIPGSLQARNSSILAHGFTPVSSKAFESFLNAVLDLLEIREADLPAFPDFGILSTW